MHDQNYLAHHGILGMKWGVRRYQNADGSLTMAGKKRQYKQERRQLKRHIKDVHKTNRRNTGFRDGENVLNVDEQVAKAKENSSTYQKYKQNADNDYAMWWRSNRADIIRKKEPSTLTKVLKKRYEDNYAAARAIGEEISSRYNDAYKNAVVKDLGYKDIKAGREALEKYDLMNYALRGR